MPSLEVWSIGSAGVDLAVVCPVKPAFDSVHSIRRYVVGTIQFFDPSRRHMKFNTLWNTFRFECSRWLHDTDFVGFINWTRQIRLQTCDARVGVFLSIL